MRNVAALFLVLFLALAALPTSAQTVSPPRFVARIADSSVIVLDSLSILPETFKLQGLDTSEYEVDFVTARLRLKRQTAIGKSFTCSFRTFSLNFARKFSHKSTDLLLPRLAPDASAHQFVSLPSETAPTIFDSQLQGAGSIARSVTVGNNQNFVLDANLNLQLSGYLAPDLEILANITDENLPLQPEGNTRYIKDFNKVFIQLKYKNQFKLAAGDIELRSPQNSYFFQLNRQFLGLDCQINSRIDSVNSFSNRVGGGVTKGKFVRNVITAIHGVQGPYKLSGEQNETNIVVLAASEKVYLDGLLLTRGQDNDYTIDYNLGEITFTAKHLITSENRIIVTFEYSDQYYSRFNVFTINEFRHEKNDRVRLSVDFFHEQDLKRQSIMPELTDEQMIFLAGIGDRTGTAAYSSAIPVADALPNEVLYHRRDTLVNAVLYSPVYVYAGNSRDSVYRLTFSYVGPHAGDYVLSKNTTNGKLFQWVAPVDGVPQGDYAPVQLLATPKQTDLLTVAANYAPNKHLTLQTEAAFSYADHNLFSKTDDHDNAGLACKVNLAFHTPLRKSSDTLWAYELSLDYEWVHKNFTPLETFRSIEFFRDYNLESDYSSAFSEQLLQLSTGFSHPKKGSSFYTLNWLLQFHNLYALRNELNSHHQLSGWNLNTNTAFLLSRDQVQTTDFLKSMNDFSKSFSKIMIGLKDNVEFNEFHLASTSALRENSYAFNEAVVYLASADSSRCDFNLQVKNRLDAVARDNVLSLNAIAYEAQASFQMSQWRHHRLKVAAIYRNDQVRNPQNNFMSDHNFVGNIDYAANFWKGALSFNIYYEVGSGLEQKKTYTFLQVAAGQGTHVWIDYNGDGIESLDEFELAAFQSEADYVKVWLSTNEYVNTFNNAANASLQLRPANVWRNRKGFLGFLSKWANVTSLRTSQKNSGIRLGQALNPFAAQLPDSAVVANSFNLKNNLTFVLPSNYFSAEYVAAENRSENLLYYGLESVRLRQQQLTLRSVPTRILMLKTMYGRTVKENGSQYLASHNFKILSHLLDNSLTVNLKCNLSLTALWSMTYKRNLLSDEKANLYKACLDADYRMRERGTLTLALQYVRVLYNATDRSNSLSYEILDGLTVGHNFLWNLSYQTKLFDYLQLALHYEGRLTNDNTLIHSGTIQLKALF